ncbi:hypothetical protein SELMODRAFT_72074, partial [Selaginella moellendorffii]
LLRLYGKCGCLDEACRVFDGIAHKDVYTWTAMIGAYAQAGSIDGAKCLFDQMPERNAGFPADQVACLSGLVAQTHIGRVPQCCAFFRSMQQDFGVAPLAEHFLCVVDLLGKAGHLERAEELVETMPYEPHAKTWGALLGACRLHADVGRASGAARNLFAVDTRDSGSHVLVSNMCA